MRLSVKRTYVIDTNVIIRYLLADHPEHFRKAKAFMDRVKTGEVKAFIPEGVIVECVYVLLKFYEVPKSKIAESLIGILNYKGITNPDRDILIQGIRLFEEKKVDIVDAIISAISSERDWPCFSFDKDIERLNP